MESDDEFADFTSAFPSTGQEIKMDGISAFHEIGGSVFEIPPLNFEDDDQFSPTNSMNYSINTSSSGGPLGLTLPPPISDPLAVPNGDVPLDPLPDLPSLNGFTFPPLSDELIAPSSVEGTIEQAIGTNTNEQVITENNKDVTVTVETTGTAFANFASFESMETPLTMETTGSDFSGFVAATEDTLVTVAAKNDIGFANFPSPPPESVTDDYFGSFKSQTIPEIDSNPLDDEDNSFGNFSSFSEAIPKTEKPNNTLPVISTVKEMTSLQEPAEDDFGDFGSFTIAPPAAIVAPPTSTPAPKSTSLKISVDVLINCFPISVINNTTTSTVKHLKEYLISVENSNKMWTSIKDKADSTSFFYQWNQSFLQDRFYTAVNVDPMLVPANAKSGLPSAGEPLLTLDTLSGGAGNLLEGFGFDTSIKSKAQPQDSGFGWTDEGATLLDLSLPTSPIAPQEQISAVIFGEDLLGVDLTAIDLTAPPPNSNNVLEETPTSWMDSELLELEAETQHMPQPTSSTSSYDWLARLTSISTSSSVNPQGDIPTTDLLTATTTNGLDLLTSGNLDTGELDIISSSVTMTTENMGWSFESAPLVPDTVVKETTTISTSETSSPLPPPSTHEEGVTPLQKSSPLSNKVQNLLDRLPNLYYMTHDSMLYVT